MKTAEELLKEKGIKPETVHHNYAYVYRAVCGIIGEVQKEAYNQAIDDAVMNAEAKVEVWYDFGTGYYQQSDVIVDRNSILKLKK